VWVVSHKEKKWKYSTVLPDVLLSFQEHLLPLAIKPISSALNEL